MKMKNVILSFLFIMIFVSCSHESETLSVESGLLDLSDYSFQFGSRVQMDGEWEFYWNRLIEPGNFEGEDAGFLYVPSKWNSYEVDGAQVGSAGCATYRLKVRVPDGLDSLAIYGNTISTAFKLWVDGELLAESGVVSEVPEEVVSRFLNFVCGFSTEEKEEVEIVLQVANTEHRYGGIGAPLILGDLTELQNQRDRRYLLSAFVVGSLLIVGFYNLFLYFFRRKEKTALHFFLLSLIMVFRIITIQEKLILMAFPEIPWQLLSKMGYISFYAFAAVFFSFLGRLFPEDEFPAVRKAAEISLILYVLFVSFTPSSVFTRFYYFYLLLMVVWVAFSGVILFRAWRAKRPGSLSILIGYLVLMIGFVCELLLSLQIPVISGTFAGKFITNYTTQLGMLILFIMYALGLVRRFCVALAHEEELVQTLEETVEKRTEMLKSERAKLKQRSEKVHEEILMAREILLQFLPKKSPGSEISFVYEPVELVGGDFFDFFQLEDGGTAVFFGAVSGSRISAAFQTSIIKTTFSELSPRRFSPRQFLSELNERLVPYSNGNFVTAFYGIFSPESPEFRYGLAGEQSLWLVSDGKVQELSSDSYSYPLGVFYEAEIADQAWQFTSETLPNKTGNLLFLFNDGLLKAMEPSGSEKSFNELSLEFKSLVERFLEKNPSSLEPEAFLKGVRGLISYKMETGLKNDICMICLKI